MWRDYPQQVLHWMRNVILKPWEELNRWQRAVRFSYDLARHGLRQLQEDRAPQMAAALAYESLFALVPILVVTMILVRGIIGVEEFQRRVQGLLESAGLAHVMLTGLGSSDKAPDARSLQDWLEGLISQAGQIDQRTVGWVGFAVIIYAAISILVTIERSFNTIYRTPEGRPWVKRVPLYWFLITASPIALSATAVLHGQIEHVAGLVSNASWFAVAVGFCWSISLGWIFWFAVYSLVPNTSVHFRSSAIGALVCVVLLEISKRTFGAYMTRGFAVTQLYSSLGLIPLFMFWVYLMWLVVLFGLEVSAMLQFLGNRTLEEIETRRSFAAVIEPAVVVMVMEMIGEDFRAGRASTQRRITDRAGIPEAVVGAILQELCSAGLLHRVEGDRNTVCLTQPPEHVMVDRLLELGFRLADEGGERWISAFAVRLREEQRALAGHVTLASLLSK